MKLARGAVVVVDLDPTMGREQRGVWPCIIVSDPETITDQRFPLVSVVPITGTPGQGLLYPSLSPGKSGLAKQSFALIDHLRSIDKRRVRRAFGELAAEEVASIDDGLSAFLGLRAGSTTVVRRRVTDCGRAPKSYSTGKTLGYDGCK